jgi:hypothetical protein
VGNSTQVDVGMQLFEGALPPASYGDVFAVLPLLISANRICHLGAGRGFGPKRRFGFHFPKDFRFWHSVPEAAATDVTSLLLIVYAAVAPSAVGLNPYICFRF